MKRLPGSTSTADAEPATVLEARLRAGRERNLAIDDPGIHDHGAGRRGTDREGGRARRGEDGPGVQQRAVEAVELNPGRARAGCADQTIIGDDAIGARRDANGARRRDTDRAIIDDVIPADAGKAGCAGLRHRESAGVADGIIDPGDGDEIIHHAVSAEIEADGISGIDRVNGGQGRAGNVQLGPFRRAVRPDMQDGGMRSALGIDPIRGKIIFAVPAPAGDPLEMGGDGARMVIGGEGAGGHVVQETVLGIQAERVGLAARHFVAIDAIGAGHQRARPRERRIGSRQRMIDEGPRRPLRRVEIAHDIIAELAMWNGVRHRRAARRGIDDVGILGASRRGGVEDIADVSGA